MIICARFPKKDLCNKFQVRSSEDNGFSEAVCLTFNDILRKINGSQKPRRRQPCVNRLQCTSLEDRDDEIGFE